MRQKGEVIPSRNLRSTWNQQLLIKSNKTTPKLLFCVLTLSYTPPSPPQPSESKHAFSNIHFIVDVKLTLGDFFSWTKTVEN